MKEPSVENCPQNAPGRLLRFLLRILSEVDLRVRQHSLFFLPVIPFCLRKRHLGVSRLSFSTDSAFYFLFHVPFLSFPYHYPPWFRLCIFCSVLLSCLPLALAGVSLPFRALSSPCRTRSRKAASAQSSRSGGEGGNVHVGMDSKHR